jgi:hypothetical protein
VAAGPRRGAPSFARTGPGAGRRCPGGGGSRGLGEVARTSGKDMDALELSFKGMATPPQRNALERQHKRDKRRRVLVANDSLLREAKQICAWMEHPREMRFYSGINKPRSDRSNVTAKEVRVSPLSARARCICMQQR